MNCLALSLALIVGGPPSVETENTPRTQLYVCTTPPGAQIAVDGQPRATSPHLFDVPPGVRKMTIDVVLDDHYPKKRQVIIRGGRITRVMLDLTRKPQTTERVPSPAAGVTTESTSARLKNLPPGWILLKSFVVPRDQTAAIEKRLGGRIAHLSNTFFAAHEQRVQVNVIECPSTEDADRVHRAVLGMKGDSAFCLRFDETIVEFVGTFDAAFARRAAVELGLREEPVAKMLARKVSLEFDDAQLEDVVEFLKDYLKEFGQINIVFDRKALAEAGIDSQAPVTIKLSDVTLQSALHLVLRQVGLTWTERHEVLLITTPEAAKRMSENDKLAGTVPGLRHTEAETKGLVEDFFRHNYRDVTSRETIEWGDFANHEDGSSSIRYKCRATIWGKDVKILNQVFTFDAKGKFVSVKDAENDTTGGPEKARLDFRIAATRNSDENPGLSDEVIQRHVADLGAHGPDAQRGSDGEHAWFELRNEIPNHLIAATHDSHRYALLSTRPAEVMLDEDEGHRAWGLTQVSAAKDNQGRPVIKLTFDEAGARRMKALTAANLRRPLAILIDEKVVSAPRVMTVIGGSVEITGRFTEAEVERLVTALQAARTQ